MRFSASVNGMYIRRPQELKWHCAILQGNLEQFDALKLAYQQIVFDHVTNGFGSYLRHDVLLVSEAVWYAFEQYREHPREFDFNCGSLLSFLKLAALRRIQQLLEEENRCWHFQQLDFILARYFRTERDIRLARLLVKRPFTTTNRNDLGEFARILNTGELRIELQLREIYWHIARVQRVLSKIPVNFAAMAGRRSTIAKVRRNRSEVRG
jgi:hypothetical protein